MVFAVLLFGLAVCNTSAQSADKFLGIKLRPDVREIVREIENKTGKRIHSEFVRQEEFLLASSFVDDDTGAAFVLVDQSLEDDADKLQAVIAHELLHLRLRVNNYPTFIFSPSVRTAKGRAIDVEQEHVNDLLSLIEHRVFKADMEKFGLYKYIDLAGDTAADARNRKGDQDGQADALNYARAILEYSDPRDVNMVKQLFQANGWTRSLKEGSDIAGIIAQSDPRTVNDVQAVFLRSLMILFPPPKTAAFKITVDPTNKYFRRMVINLSQIVRKRG